MSDTASVSPQEVIVEALFETEALRVAPHDKPFWYAAGTIGPYYCNTHFLFDGEATATEALKAIDAALADGDRRNMSQPILCAMVARRYAAGGAYAKSIDALAKYIERAVNMDSVEAISGGERRDWFFSFAVARMFNKGHIAVYKDMKADYLSPEALAACWDGVDSRDGGNGKDSRDGSGGGNGKVVRDGGDSLKMTPVADLSAESPPFSRGARVLHVCDLVTEASSHKKAWIPALEALGIRICDSVAIVDRLQGGGEVLAKLGVKHHAVATLDGQFFDRALAAKRIDADQRERVASYVKNRSDYVVTFLAEHPNYVADAIAAGGKNAERARMLMQKL